MILKLAVKLPPDGFFSPGKTKYQTSGGPPKLRTNDSLVPTPPQGNRGISWWKVPHWTRGFSR